LGVHLKHVLMHSPDSVSVYIAYVDGIPASAAWIDFHQLSGSQFAGLWGGSTLSEYRNRGLYTDLVAARAQEAIRRGIRFMTIDASPMSRAVLEKLGFRLLCMTVPMKFRG
jgi:predicted GNAT family acetyltransferase